MRKSGFQTEKTNKQTDRSYEALMCLWTLLNALQVQSLFSQVLNFEWNISKNSRFWAFSSYEHQPIICPKLLETLVQKVEGAWHS